MVFQDAFRRGNNTDLAAGRESRQELAPDFQLASLHSEGRPFSAAAQLAFSDAKHLWERRLHCDSDEGWPESLPFQRLEKSLLLKLDIDQSPDRVDNLLEAALLARNLADESSLSKTELLVTAVLYNSDMEFRKHLSCVANKSFFLPGGKEKACRALNEVYGSKMARLNEELKLLCVNKAIDAGKRVERLEQAAMNN